MVTFIADQQISKIKMRVNAKGLMLTALMAGAVLTGCEQNAAEDDSVEMTAEENRAFDMANLDTTAGPCDNFYQFAAGGWLQDNPVPGTESRWGSFNILMESNNDKLRALAEQYSSKSDLEKGTHGQWVGDFYHSAMDSAAIEQAGIAPLQSAIEKIDAVSNRKELLKTVADMRRMGMGPMMSLYISRDAKKSDEYIAYIGQGGMGLPDRDYYLTKGAESDRIRKEYKMHVQKMFELMGKEPAKAKASMETVFRIEKRLAEASMTRTERRDIDKTYNKMTLDEVKGMTPNIDWALYLEALGAGGVDNMIVSQPDFYKALNTMLKDVSVDDWKVYLKWHLINGSAPYLSSKFENQDFHFYRTVLSGTKEMKPRWKRALNNLSGSLGEPLGKLFVEEHFPEESKKFVSDMVEHMRETYIERVKQADWMGDSTKQKAVEKLKAFTYKIGYPDKWRNYDGLEIVRDSYVKNAMATNKADFEYMISKLGKEVDKDEWFMSPQTVNAYYSSSGNEIVFPAGILQPPFYDANADDALNYGGIGAVIGHEFTHGFDDQGSKFDDKGNLNNWWTEEDRANFMKRADVVVNQFGEFQPLDSVFVNGQLTLGENIADLGGLTLAYHAMQKAHEGKEIEKIDGFTPEQRFFLGWAQVWKNNITESELRKRVITDSHSPGEFRVNGPIANMEEFRKAWGCSPGDRMVRQDTLQAVIW